MPARAAPTMPGPRPVRSGQRRRWGSRRGGVGSESAQVSGQSGQKHPPSCDVKCSFDERRAHLDVSDGVFQSRYGRVCEVNESRAIADVRRS